jgi:uncharacterized protein (TIGR02147 family)
LDDSGGEQRSVAENDVYPVIQVRGHLRLKVKLERLEHKGKSSDKTREDIDKLVASVGKVSRQVVSLSAFESVAQWYCMVIKQLIATGDFVEDAEWVCRRLRHKIRPHQMKKAIDHLLALELIQRNPQTGQLESAHADTTPSDIPSQALVQHHIGMIDRAREALEEQKVADRCFMGLTLRADAKQTANVKRDIAQFIEMMNEKYAVEDSTRVYQLNLQYFEHTTETSPQERLQ